MQFGKVQDPSKIDFRLPAITDRTIRVLSESKDLNLQVAIVLNGTNKNSKTFIQKELMTSYLITLANSTVSN